MDRKALRGETFDTSSSYCRVNPEQDGLLLNEAVSRINIGALIKQNIKGALTFPKFVYEL